MYNATPNPGGTLGVTAVSLGFLSLTEQRLPAANKEYFRDKREAERA